MLRSPEPKIFDFERAKRYFGSPSDPGYIYVLRDRGRYKIGKSKQPRSRIRSARTWIPDVQTIGVKPFWFHGELEKYLQVGLAQFSLQREWYDFEGDEFEDWFVEEWTSFHDGQPDKNTRDFTYFMNGTGMAEFTLAWSSQEISKSKFLWENSGKRE